MVLVFCHKNKVLRGLPKLDVRFRNGNPLRPVSGALRPVSGPSRPVSRCDHEIANKMVSVIEECQQPRLALPTTRHEGRGPDSSLKKAIKKAIDIRLETCVPSVALRIVAHYLNTKSQRSTPRIHHTAGH